MGEMSWPPGKGKSNPRPDPRLVRARFDQYVAGDEGFRIIPDSPVALELKKERRVLAGNDERVFVFREEYVANFVNETYGSYGPRECHAMTMSLMAELLDWKGGDAIND